MDLHSQHWILVSCSQRCGGSCLFAPAFRYCFLGSPYAFADQVTSQTFRSYSYAPLLEILKSEIRHFGPLSFFCAGMPFWTVAHIINTWRNYLMESTVEWVLHRFQRRPTDKNKRKSFQAQVDRYSNMFVLPDRQTSEVAS